jgi:alkaline phosphatase D
VGTYPVNFSTGYIWSTDPTGNNWFTFSAPSKFLGNQSGNYSGTLSFDLKDQNSDNVMGTAVDLVGAGHTLQYAYNLPAGNNWTHFAITLLPTSWTDSSGADLTPAVMSSVLGSLEAIYISGDWKTGPDTSSLANVTLTTPTPTPIPSTFFLLGPGLAGLCALRRRFMNI